MAVTKRRLNPGEIVFDSGELRDRVTVENLPLTEEQEDTGEPHDKYPRKVCGVWVNIIPVGGGVRTIADQPQAEVTHRVRTWLRSDVTTDTRLRVEGCEARYLYITNVLKDWRNGTMELACLEAVS